MLGIGHIAAGALFGTALLGLSHYYAYNKGGAAVRAEIAINNAQEREARLIKNNERAAEIKEASSRINDHNKRIDAEAVSTGSGCGFSDSSLLRINSIR